MSIRNVARFAGATRQIRQSAQNLQSIRAAREKREQESELFDLNKKKAKLQIEELELKGDKSAVEVKFFNTILDDMFKTQSDIAKGKDAQIDLAEQSERNKAKSASKVAESALEDPDVSALLGGQQPEVGLEGSSVAQNVNPRVPSSNQEQRFELFGDTKSGFGFRVKKQADKLKQKKELRLTEEQQLRDFRNDFQTLDNFGGTVNKEFIDRSKENLGIDISEQFEAGRAEPIVDSQGNKAWRVLSKKEWDNKVATSKFSPTEVEHLQNINQEHRAWTNVLERLKEFEDLPENVGTIETESIVSPIGPISLPARFNLAGQFAKDPRFTAVKRDVELAFQAFRKRVTGAQASDRELKLIRPLIASFTDRPGVFFQTIKNAMENVEVAFEDRLDIYNRAGRDTKQFENFFGEKKGLQETIKKDDTEDKVKQALEAGFSQEEIDKFLEGRN